MKNVDRIEKAYTVYRDELIRLAQGLLGDGAEDAQDIVQDVFVTLMEKNITLWSPQHPSTRKFLRTVTRNRCLNRLRARSHEVPDEDSLEKAESADNLEMQAVEESLSRWKVKALREAIQKLSPRHQDILWLSYYSGKTTPQIAAALGLKENAVYALRSRALHALQKTLEEENLRYEDFV